MNQIRKIIQARIDNIIQLSEVAGEIPHQPTVGDLRETYLLEFFRTLVPDSVSITSGFITDFQGTMSPQLDFIVYMKSALPLMVMKDGLSIVPMESVVVFAEIKSTLTTTHLKQVKMQNTTLASMKLSAEIKEKRFIIPSFILAYDTNIASDSLKTWMSTNGNTFACCTLKQDTYIRDEGIRVFDNIAFDIKHYGVLAFIATFYRALHYLVSERDIEPTLDYYLTARPST